MASTARLGLKLQRLTRATGHTSRRNGLYSPFGIETEIASLYAETYPGRNGLYSPFGIETTKTFMPILASLPGRNGLYSPFGIETVVGIDHPPVVSSSEWPLQPVWD